MTRRRRASAEPLGELLPAVVRRVRQRHRALAAIQERWPRLVGPALAAHTKPVSLRRGRLVVNAAEPGDAFALQYERGHILARLRRARGVAVQDVVIRAGDV